MRVTTRTRYAIRALYDLAFHRRGQSALAKEIAARQQIPLRFLEQILQDLRRAGLVEARREVSLGDVLRAARGPLEEVLGVDERAPVDDIPALVWAEVGARLIDVLEQTTLADFVARAEAAGVRRAVLPATMYFI
jgi:DNA-binding IscR family transcriptional regulator